MNRIGFWVYYTISRIINLKSLKNSIVDYLGHYIILPGTACFFLFSLLLKTQKFGEATDDCLEVQKKQAGPSLGFRLSGLGSRV